MEIFDKWNKRIMLLIMAFTAFNALSYYFAIKELSNTQEIAITNYILDFVVNTTHNQIYIFLSVIFVVRIIFNNIEQNKKEVLI